MQLGIFRSIRVRPKGGIPIFPKMCFFPQKMLLVGQKIVGGRVFSGRRLNLCYSYYAMEGPEATRLFE